jgi:hypothetical protein
VINIEYVSELPMHPNERHDPRYLRAARYGAWVECSCGWRSHYGNLINAQLRFGEHLIEIAGGAKS